jgi:hypothetical protein
MSYILTAEGETMSVSFSRSTPAEALAKLEDIQAEGHRRKDHRAGRSGDPRAPIDRA